MERLSSVDGIVVSRHKEWEEKIKDFKGRNMYTISDTAGNGLYLALEEGVSVLVRWLLKALRPFTIIVFRGDAEKNVRVALAVKRLFRFYFHQVRVYDRHGRLLGTVRRQFSVARRLYSVSDCSGMEVCRLSGPILHPWTFRIMSGGIECGKITKRWSGLLEEKFTDADNFTLTFPMKWDVRSKALLLGAVFLIDFMHFENKSS